MKIINCKICLQYEKECTSISMLLNVENGSSHSVGYMKSISPSQSLFPDQLDDCNFVQVDEVACSGCGNVLPSKVQDYEPLPSADEAMQAVMRRWNEYNEV